MRNFAIAGAIVLIVVCPASAQRLAAMPPSGDNQHAAVTQFIGPVNITVDYNSPRVTRGANDRRGKIWGELVPWGLQDLGFGMCRQCPWRGGANENTTLAFSHDVMVEGQKLPAGKYGLFFIPDPNEWTVIFSKNSTSWGAYTYDAAEDALRVKVKPVKNPYREWLTYEFTDRSTDHATLALQWEELAVPLAIAVPNLTDLNATAIRNELRNATGFDPRNWVLAARWALDNKRPDEALEYALIGVNGLRGGQANESFQSLVMLADAQEAKGLPEAKATRERALSHASAQPPDLHMYARQALIRGNKDEAIRVWKLNAKNHPNAWPVNVGLMRAYSAEGKYKDALRYAKLALAQASDDGNKRNLEQAIKKLEEGKDVN